MAELKQTEDKRGDKTPHSQNTYNQSIVAKDSQGLDQQ